MDNKKYMDALDRIYLNSSKLEKLKVNTRSYNDIKKQIEEDQKIANNCKELLK